MKNKNFITMILLVVVLVLILSACRIGEAPELPDVEAPAIEEPEAEIPAPEPSDEEILMGMILGMTLEEKLGQLVMIGIEGTQATQEELIFINEKKVGGVILFQRNILDSGQVIDLVNSLRTENISNPVPLFLGIDEEGGRVTRLSAIFENLPSLSILGINDDQDLSYRYGAIQAEKLSMLGLNLNFSPVLDVASNPSNPVIGDRAISSDPHITARNGIELVKGMLDNMIIPVGKHFPGHGDTGADSHISLPVISKGIDQLKEHELIPFESAIEIGLPSVMIGHLLVESVDDKPASMSQNMICGLLREDMGFEGVVFSDDMTMGAITERYGIPEASLNFVMAGGDIALICHGLEPANEFLELLRSSVEEGVLAEAEIDANVFRILRLKRSMKISNDIVPVLAESDIDNRIKSLKAELGE